MRTRRFGWIPSGCCSPPRSSVRVRWRCFQCFPSITPATTSTSPVAATRSSGCADRASPPRWPGASQCQRRWIDRKPPRMKRLSSKIAPPTAAGDADSAAARLARLGSHGSHGSHESSGSRASRGKAVIRPSRTEIATTKFRSSTWMTARIRMRARAAPGVEGAEVAAPGPVAVMPRQLVRNPNPDRMLQAPPTSIPRAVRVHRAAAVSSAPPVPR